MVEQTLFGGVGATLPARWSDRSIYTFVAPDDRGSRFFSNLVATREAASDDVEAYAATQLRAAKTQLAELHLVEQNSLRVGGHAAVVAVFTFVAPPHAVKVEQLQAFVRVGDWVYTFTFSALAEVFKDKRAEFDAILSSITFA
jgi:hypothetical protein